MSVATIKQPKPLPVEAYRPFPVDLLPGVVRRYVMEASAAIGCDSAYVALPMLSALASAIGSARVIALKPDWHEPPILWTAVIGESGTHKTPAQKAALYALRKRETRLFDQHNEALQLYEIEELTKHAEAVKQWKLTKQGPCPAEPPLPTLKRLLCGDTTVEALAIVLSENPHGLLLTRDELSGFFGSFNAYKPGSGDESFWLELHQGNAINIDRKTGPKTMIHVPRPMLSITGGIQPGILQDVLGKAKFDSGLAARFLMAMPTKRAKQWDERSVHADTQLAIQTVFDGLYDLCGAPDDEPIAITLSPEAKAVFIAFYNKHTKEQATLSGPLASAWSKLEAYAARLALVIHEVRVAECDPLIHDPHEIDVQSIQAGITLVRWFGHETKRIYAYLQGNEEGRQWCKVAEFIARRDGQATSRELQRSLYQGMNNEEVSAELAVFVDNGWLERFDASSSTNGRPSMAYRLAKGMTYDKTPDSEP